jgi:hypothetical protein
MVLDKSTRVKDWRSRKRGTQASASPKQGRGKRVTRARQARPLSARIRTRAYGENIWYQRYITQEDILPTTHQHGPHKHLISVFTDHPHYEAAVTAAACLFQRVCWLPRVLQQLVEQGY